MDADPKPTRRPHGPGPTAKDVARLAGVSQSTVSRILNGDRSHFFSEKTRSRVLRIASDLGYSPNPIARALRGKHLNLIGVIVREISDPFFAALISEITVQARELGFLVVLGHAHSDPDEALEMSSIFDTRHTDGAVILGDLKNDQAAIKKILAGKRAVVAMCRGVSSAEVTTINSDNRAGIEALLGLLLRYGHRRIAFIDGGWLGDIQERKNRFIEVLEENGIQLEPDWVVTEANTAEGGYRAAQRLLACPSRPTAILASDDLMAIGALKGLQDGGVRVPEEVSLAGFDGLELTRFVSPALTTVRQPVEEMSRTALQLLIDQIEGRSTNEHRLICLKPELISRASTGPSPGFLRLQC
jgi:LacI family transcriptional regulator